MKTSDLLILAAIVAAAFVLLRQPASAGASSPYRATIKGATWQPPAIDAGSSFWSEKEPGWG